MTVVFKCPKLRLDIVFCSHAYPACIKYGVFCKRMPCLRAHPPQDLLHPSVRRLQSHWFSGECHTPVKRRPPRWTSPVWMRRLIPLLFTRISTHCCHGSDGDNYAMLIQRFYFAIASMCTFHADVTLVPPCTKPPCYVLSCAWQCCSLTR